MLEEVYSQTKEQMEKSIEALRRDYKTLRTGKVNVNILDNIKVDYYGSLTPLKQMGNISSPEPRMLVVQVYDSSALDSVEKAIRSADLGLNPSRDGQLIRVLIPALTEDRRRDLIKSLHKQAEEYKIQIRNHRRDSVDLVKKGVKDKAIAEDDSKKQQDEIQKHTDRFVAEIDAALVHKEKDLMEV